MIITKLESQWVEYRHSEWNTAPYRSRLIRSIWAKNPGAVRSGVCLCACKYGWHLFVYGQGAGAITLTPPKEWERERRSRSIPDLWLECRKWKRNDYKIFTLLRGDWYYICGASLACMHSHTSHLYPSTMDVYHTIPCYSSLSSFLNCSKSDRNEDFMWVLPTLIKIGTLREIYIKF